MKMNHKWMLAGALLAAAGAANAGEFSSTVTATSDYDFRGVSQSAKDPALQLSLDYGLDNGIYVGAWASNVDFGGDESVEANLYLGWAFEHDNGTSWDFGYVRYLYPGDNVDADYDEFYVNFGYVGLGLEVWYSPDYGQTGLETFYYAANYDFELVESWTLNLHAGYNTGQYFKQGWDSGPGSRDGSYFEYSVGVTKTLGNFELNVRYQGVDVPTIYEERGDILNSESRVIFTVSTTLPW
jgi:uncharacterized protein (TIGR02001 family)